MVFSPEAARKAQAFADKLTEENKMYHSKRDERDNCGENLAMHSNKDLIANTPIATQMWYSEVNDPGYDFAKGTFGYGTGHFTQVVWKGSTELGCGISGVFVVCHY